MVAAVPAIEIEIATVKVVDMDEMITENDLTMEKPMTNRDKNVDISLLHWAYYGHC